MPRKTPLPLREVEIGKRIKAVREAWKMPRRALANAVEVDRMTLARIEQGRAVLRYGIAFRLMRFLRLNPRWLATGVGARDTAVKLPSPEELAVQESVLFTEVFSSRLRDVFEPRVDEKRGSPLPAEDLPPGDVFYRRVRIAMITAKMKSWFAVVPDAHVDELAQRVSECAEDLLQGWPKDSRSVLARRMVDMEALDLRAKETADKESGLKTNLTNTATSVSGSPMQDKWPALKKQLQAATEKTGKSALAKFLKVDLTRISQWLTDADSQREPGAEYALQMQDWLKRQQT